MAALSSQLTSEGKLSKAAQTLINQNSASAPVSPKVHRPSTGNSQRAAAMAALSVMLGTKSAASTVSGENTMYFGCSTYYPHRSSICHLL
jgi:hypothetical protein